VAFELELIPTNSGSNTKKYKEMKKSIWTGSSAPQSFITKGKHRLKQHIDTVYLNNGDEFEVELFNPTQTKVLAKIEMNGNSIGSGIILRPGERVFLERYLDEAKKFLFETYEVNGNDKEVQKAIMNNGDVVVKFYEEQKITTFTNVSYQPWYGTTLANTLSGSSTGVATFTTTGGSFNSTSTNLTNVNSTFTSGNTAFYNSSNVSNTLGGERRIKKTTLSTISSTETGRVEKGSNSNQSFSTDYSNFNSYPMTTNWWRILPNSQKLLTKEDLVTYCTECGSKRKKDTHKFCPSCGTKF
jgi:NADH pyrophosphatase NudC (nudix superfamily)